MQNYSLDDLIIDSPVDYQKKKKGPMVLAALVLILLILVIFISKMILEPSDTNTTQNEDTKVNIVKPDVISVKDEEKSSNERLDSIIEDKLLDKAVVPKSITDDVKPKEPEQIIKQLKPAVSFESNNTNITTNDIANNQKSTEKKSKKPKVEKPKIEKKHKIEKKVPKKPSELFNSHQTEYFVQVGAFNRDPSEKYLNKIKNAGFAYVIHKSGKTQRVRVGPFSSKDIAKQKLSDINSSIGIQGFIIRRKR